jgi:hypothetical protein
LPVWSLDGPIVDPDDPRRQDLIKPGAASGYLVDFSTRPLWLLKGRDRTGRNDFSVGHIPR